MARIRTFSEKDAARIKRAVQAHERAVEDNTRGPVSRAAFQRLPNKSFTILVTMDGGNAVDGWTYTVTDLTGYVLGTEMAPQARRDGTLQETPPDTPGLAYFDAEGELQLLWANELLECEEEEGVDWDAIIDRPSLIQVLHAQRYAATATGAGDQTLADITIPANTLVNHRAIRVTAEARRTTGAGQFTFRAYFDGTITANVGTLATGNMTLDLLLWADGDTSNQRYRHRRLVDSGSRADTGAMTKDATGDLTLSLRCLLQTGSDVVTLDWVSVEVVA
jgi:hypothetical protein